MISVVIPIYNESSAFLALLETLVCLPGIGEIIIVDASEGEIVTESIVTNSSVPIRILRTEIPGRALQMNIGAKSSNGDILLFLHADTHLPRTAANLIETAMNEDYVWGRFDVELDAEGILFRMIEVMMNWRSALTGICTGDQAIFVDRDIFERIGGFAETPLMEDIELSKRLKRIGRPVILKQRVITSARRWQGDGVIPTILRMWMLRFLYWSGVSSDRLAGSYRNTRS